MAVPAAVAAAAARAGQKDPSFAQRKEEKMGNVGNTTGSMLYGFGAFLVIYLAGVLIYQVVLWIQKWKRKKKDGEQENG